MRYTLNQIDNGAYEVVWEQSGYIRSIVLTIKDDATLINDILDPEKLERFVRVLSDNVNDTSDNNEVNYTNVKQAYNNNRAKFNNATTQRQIGSFISASYTNGSLTFTTLGGDEFIVPGFSTGSGGSSFPFTGSAIISGSLIITGSTNINGLLRATSITSSFTGSLTGTLIGTASYVTGSIFTATNPAANSTRAASASFANTASFATTSSHALNGGVTQVVAGTNVTISPTNGLGVVTINVSTQGGDGGTPGGGTNEIQFNDGVGGFGGAANVEISTAGNLNLVATTDPATPAAGVLTMYSKTIAGRTVPKVKGPSGLDYTLQASLWQNAIYIWNQTNVTNGVWMGTTGAGSGTFANTNPTANGTIYTTQKRARYSSTNTPANQILGQRNNEVLFFRGASTGLGGFFFYARCGFDTWANGGRFFAGMNALTTGAVVSTDPSTNNNTIGFCVDSGDNGAISFLTRATSTGTKQPTGLTITSGKGYDVFIFCKPNDTAVHYRIVDLNTGTEYSNTATLTLPSNTTMFTANVLASNAALSGANAIQLGVVKMYIETDY